MHLFLILFLFVSLIFHKSQLEKVLLQKLEEEPE